MQANRTADAVRIAADIVDLGAGLEDLILAPMATWPREVGSPARGEWLARFAEARRVIAQMREQIDTLTALLPAETEEWDDARGVLRGLYAAADSAPTPRLRELWRSLASVAQLDAEDLLSG